MVVYDEFFDYLNRRCYDFYLLSLLNIFLSFCLLVLTSRVSSYGLIVIYIVIMVYESENPSLRMHRKAVN